MRKGAHLRIQYPIPSLKLGKSRFCTPKFWSQLRNCMHNFEQVPPSLMVHIHVKVPSRFASVHKCFYIVRRVWISTVLILCVKLIR